MPLPVSGRRRRSSRLSQRKAWRNSRRKRRKLQRRPRSRPSWSVVLFFVCFFFSGLLFHIRRPLLQLLLRLWRALLQGIVGPGGLVSHRGGKRIHCLSIPVILALFMSTQTKRYFPLHWVHDVLCSCMSSILRGTLEYFAQRGSHSLQRLQNFMWTGVSNTVLWAMFWYTDLYQVNFTRCIMVLKG